MSVATAPAVPAPATTADVLRPPPDLGHAPARDDGRDVAEAFLIPSVFGDEPQLQDLRRRMQGILRFELLPLPDVGARGGLIADMAATGRALADEVLLRRPDGPLALVGYSFGASMALEVAAQLAERGRGVAFFVALDGPFEPPTVAARRDGPTRSCAPSASSVSSILAAPRRLLRSVAVDAVESLNAVRRLVAGSASPDADPGDRAQAMRRAMLWHLRNKALKGWTPRGCPAPGLRVSTGDYGPGNAARWGELCPNLRTVSVAAVHEHLLKGEALDAVVGALADAVRRSAPGRA